METVLLAPPGSDIPAPTHEHARDRSPVIKPGRGVSAHNVADPGRAGLNAVVLDPLHTRPARRTASALCGAGAGVAGERGDGGTIGPATHVSGGGAVAEGGVGVGSKEGAVEDGVG